MMKRIVYLSILLTVTVLSSSFRPLNDQWQKVSLRGGFSIRMPVLPSETKLAEVNTVSKTARCSDSSSVVVFVADLLELGVTEDQIAGLVGSEQFKQDLKAGFVSKGGSLVAEKEGRYQDKHYYYQCDVQIDVDDKKIVSVNRVLIYKHYAVTVIFVPGPGGMREPYMEQFFNSLEIPGS